MHSISEPRPVSSLRRALREILFVFVPLTMTGLYFLIEHPEHMKPADFIVGGLLMSRVIAPVFWLAYRVLRFTIGR